MRKYAELLYRYSLDVTAKALQYIGVYYYIAGKVVKVDFIIRLNSEGVTESRVKHLVHHNELKLGVT